MVGRRPAGRSRTFDGGVVDRLARCNLTLVPPRVKMARRELTRTDNEQPIKILTTMPRSRKQLGTVEDVEAAFYDALARADIETLMALWADDEEIVCIHPGAPRLVGHAAIRESWETIFESGGLHIHPLQLHATQNLMMAVHNVVEELKRAGSDQQEMHILATNIYLKTPLGWRIVVHHASVAPGKARTEPASSATLH